MKSSHVTGDLLAAVIRDVPWMFRSTAEIKWFFVFVSITIGRDDFFFFAQFAELK